MQQRSVHDSKIGVSVVPLECDASCAGRLVSGTEAVLVTVHSPSAISTSLPVALEEGTGRYRIELRCTEVRLGAVIRMVNCEGTE